jgi:hypothetical protein
MFQQRILVLLAAAHMCTLPLAAQEPGQGFLSVDTTTISRVLSRITEAEAAAEAATRETQQHREALTQALDRVNDVQALREAVQRLEQLRTRDSLVAAQHLTKVYDEGRDIIRDMLMTLGAVNSIHGSLRVEQRLNLATNIWADTELRNAWDWVGDAGAVVGTGFGLLALFANGEQVQNERLTIGLSTFGLSRIAAMLFGGGRSTKLEEKARFIELTRISFDDLRNRADVTQSYITKNQQFRENLQAFQRRYTSDEMRANQATAVAELNAHVIQFQEILRQVPEVISLYRTTVTRYQRYISPEIDALGSDNQSSGVNRELAAAMRRVEDAVQFLDVEYTQHFLPHSRSYTAVQAMLSAR